MPELPEVETVARDLEPYVGKKLHSITITDPRVWFESELTAEKFSKKILEKIYRHGKYLVYTFCEESLALQPSPPSLPSQEKLYLVQHLRMTGKMLPTNSPAIPSHLKQDPQKKLQLRAQLLFEGISQPATSLTFYDTRRFGTLTGVRNIQAFWQKKKMAPDIYQDRTQALAHWQKSCHESNRPIKALLLDQSALAGVGNIYADEVLHREKIYPLQKASSLSSKKSLAIFQSLEKIFSSAIQARGSSVENYLGGNGEPGNFQNFLRVYQRGGEKCLTCNRATIQSMKLIGRSSWFCGTCQPC